MGSFGTMHEWQHALRSAHWRMLPVALTLGHTWNIPAIKQPVHLRNFDFDLVVSSAVVQGARATRIDCTGGLRWVGLAVDSMVVHHKYMEYQ